MDLGTAIRTCFVQKYVDFSGRASRPEFWYWALFAWLVTAVASAIDNGFSFMFHPFWMGDHHGIEFFQNIVQLVLFLPSAAAATRRLRDAGKSFYNFFWILLPVIGWIILAVKLAAESSATSNPDNYAI